MNLRGLLILVAMFVLFAASAVAADKEPAKNQVIATIAVADFQNRNPFLEQDWISTAAPDLIGSALSRAVQTGGDGVVVLDRTAIAALDAESRLNGAAGPARGAVATHVIGGSFTISGNNLQFTTVPEPTSALAGLLIGAGLLRRRRA